MALVFQSEVRKIELAINRGLKFRIYPTKEQAIQIIKNLGCKRFIFNHFLNLRKTEYKANKKTYNYKEMCSILTNLKKYPEYSWLKEVDSNSLQQAIRDLMAAYDRFFKKLSDYPRFKSKHDHEQKYRTQMTNGNIKVFGNRIQLPKLGEVKAKLSREVVGEIKNATICRTASGKFFVTLCVKQTVNVKENHGHEVGIDVGLKHFYSDSNGNVVENPRLWQRFAKKLAREQRRLSRKMKSSGQHEKQRIKVARVHEKIVNIREDFQHKLALHLAEENQFVAVEKLNIRGMKKNRKLSKAIHDVAWGKFFQKLEYKIQEHGGKLVKVPTFYPSSQTCSVCGYKNPLVKNLNIRDWECPECHSHHDRDLNASINILNKARELA